VIPRGQLLAHAARLAQEIVDQLEAAGELLPVRGPACALPQDIGDGVGLAFRVDLMHDVANAHESTVISPNIEFSTPVSRSTYIGANVGLEFVSGKFADYYYTITPAGSVATGGVLAPFDADGGMKNWKAGLLVNQSLTGDLLHGFSIFGVGQYSHLVGDFKDSPIVSDRGSSGQWLAAAGLAYTW